MDRAQAPGAGGVAVLTAALLALAAAADSVVVHALVGSSVPRPLERGAEEFVAEHSLAVLVQGGCYLIGAGALLLLGLALPRGRRAWQRAAHPVAVGGALLAALATFALAIAAPVADPDVVGTLHALASAAGGPVQVAALGLWVLALGRADDHYPLRLRAWGVVTGLLALAGLLAASVHGLSPLVTGARIACLVWLLLVANRLAFRRRA